MLDLGCGTGPLARRLRRMGHHVTGVHPTAVMTAFSRSQPEGAAIAWHHGTIGALLPDTRFDAVIMTGHPFQCMTTPEAVAGTIGREKHVQIVAPGTDLGY